jgi:hypothetical protein
VRTELTPRCTGRLGSRCWGNPSLRSVDSECAGRGNQPREIAIGEPTSWHQRKATSSALNGLALRAQGIYTRRVRPGTWENPEISAVKSGE